MDPSLRKAELQKELTRVRQKTLWLLDQVPDLYVNVRVHDFYSPIGWHFGHIGMTEEFWSGTRASGIPPLSHALTFLFANLPENPKDNRVHLPPRDEIRAYLAETRSRAVSALEAANLESDHPLVADGYAWEFAIQHECQHQETIAELMQLIQKRCAETQTGMLRAHAAGLYAERADSPMVSLPGGVFTMGSNDRHGYDNEKQAHSVEIAPFEMDVFPVTAGMWLQFCRDGGYSRRELWTDAGWAWRESEGVHLPEYWISEGTAFGYYAADGVRCIHPDEPVSSLSWFEADAYARWAGKRLPTEAEWEFAAAWNPVTGQTQRYPWGDDPNGADAVDCELRNWAPQPIQHPLRLSWERERRENRPDPPGLSPVSAGNYVTADTVMEEIGPIGPIGGTNASGLWGMAGGVWEWTSTLFLPYPGFSAFPYDGYSKDHMDGTHYVCRGGSWATDRRILRSSFRNWYVPTYRQGFLGVRCAR